MDNKSARETAKKICSVYGQGIITNYQVKNWFSKFSSDDISLRDEPKPGYSSDLDQDTKRIGGMQSMQKYSRIRTRFQHILIHNLPPLEKDRKSVQAGCFGSSYSK